MARNCYARRILGDELLEKVSKCRVLCVGAGGIGCELLKNLVMSGFQNIDIIDLDTIDLSNLNRQFLFQKQHVRRSKAEVAKESASKFNPNVNINAILGNIKDSRFDISYFKQFDIVMNALDNLDARRHVNKMCLAANIFLVESGTNGYNGQAQPIKYGVSECYDCRPKHTPKSFPVCTIRSTPSEPIHCIVWAKSYLFPQLFGIDEEDTSELDAAQAAGENAEEIENLRKEASAIKNLRRTLSEDGAFKRVFDKVFTDDIERLLKMEDMWKNRTKPIPLHYSELKRKSRQNSDHTNVKSTISTGLRDQRKLELSDSFDMFVDRKPYVTSLEKLTKRVVSTGGDSTLDWDKDDDDSLNFATAAANLRAEIFGIPAKTRWEVKEMAGNIIPAIATSNAITAGAIVLESLNILRGSFDDLRLVWLSRTQNKWITSQKLDKPNPECAVCGTPYILVEISPESTLTLGTLIETVKARIGFTEDVSVSNGNKLVYDMDFDDNFEKPISELDIGPGTLLSVVDESDEWSSVVLVLTKSSEREENLEKDACIIAYIPQIPKKVGDSTIRNEDAVESTPILPSGKKRSAYEAELDGESRDVQERVDKKVKIIDQIFINDAGEIIIDEDEVEEVVTLDE